MRSGQKIKLFFVGLLFALYVLMVGVDFVKNNFCGATGIDYCAYWSTGKIISERGFSQIYDLNTLKEFQSPIYPRPYKNIDFFLIIPFPYLPIFALPFILISSLSIKIGYMVWTAINFIAFGWYLRTFVREMSGRALDNELLLFLYLSVPVFLNLDYGQLNIWLGIFMGEFYRNLQKGRPEVAGLWLAGLLLKPQTLILILPFLLFDKKYRVLFGFAFSAVILFLGSYYLVGNQGVIGFVNVLKGSSVGHSAANPLLMMNWRMFGLHLNNFTSSGIGNWFMVIGIVATILLLWRFLNKVSGKNELSDLKYFVIFTASMLVTWHAHFSQGIVAIPLLALLVTNKKMPTGLFNFWLIFPVAITLLIFVLPVITMVNGLAPIMVNAYRFMGGLRGFVLNIVLLVWAYHYVIKGKIAVVEDNR